MNVGMMGIKCGMTRVFTETGESVPVTVLEMLPNYVTQIKSQDKDGYTAVQVAGGQAQKANKVTKARQGHFVKAQVEARRALHEFRVDETALAEVKLGDALTVEMFEAGQAVDVSGVSKGKGFAGAIKRHNFKMQRATHGNSLSHRALGSTGQCQTPGRVFKGKRMAGQMGAVNRTAQNQAIVKVDMENHLILIKGAVPGAPGGLVLVTPSVKRKKGSE